MILSANPNVCVSSGSAFIIFYAVAHISCLSVLLVLLYWMSDTLAFAFLGDGYFCLSVNLLEPCSKYTGKALGNGLILLGLALRFVL